MWAWLAGLELLDALEEGAVMRLRKEHMGRSSTGMGRNAHVRCVAEGFQARLLFDGQVSTAQPSPLAVLGDVSLSVLLACKHAQTHPE